MSLCSLVSFCFSHLIGGADGLLVDADYSCREGVVLSPWLVEGVGRETRARMDAMDRNILQLTVLHFDTYISWKLLLWQVSSFFFTLPSILSPHIPATVCLSQTCTW